MLNTPRVIARRHARTQQKKITVLHVFIAICVLITLFSAFNALDIGSVNAEMIRLGMM